MNVKINKEVLNKLLEFEINSFIFGSQLHGIATKESDSDFVILLSDQIYSYFNTLARYLPNIHSWQYDGDNVQYVLMTETQFYRGLFSGDGNMLADIVLLNYTHPYFSNSMFLCRTQKIIKGYLGVAKRDLKLHGKNEKKRFHAFRSLYMAKCLINNVKPTVGGIVDLKKLLIPSTTDLFKNESELRGILNNLLEKGDVDMHPRFEEKELFLQILTDSNNIKEFRYEK
jgi:hypothetical protein